MCCAAPWLHWQPQKTPLFPSRPIVASKRARTDLWFRPRSSQAIQPLVARDTAQLRLAQAGPVVACNQVSWLCQPLGGTATTAPLFLSERSRHVEGLTALHDVVAARASLWATALMATTGSVRALFFW